jgi:hypothetical protein
MFGHFPVVLESLLASWFLPGRGERDIADFEKFWGGKEQHIGGIVVERIYQAAFVQNNYSKTSFLRLNRARKARGAGSDYQNIGARLRIGTAFGFRGSQHIFGTENFWHEGFDSRSMILAWDETGNRFQRLHHDDSLSQTWWGVVKGL